MKNTVISVFHAANSVLHANVDGLTHSESLVTPEPAGNSLNWVVGHLVATYNRFLPAIGGAAVWSDEQSAAYRRGSSLLDPADALPFEEIMEAFRAAHAAVVERVAELEPQQLAAPAPYSPGNNPDETIASLATVLAFHQSYHVGQTGMLRRIAGHDGAIK